MRKIDEKTGKAFWNYAEFKNGNTQVKQEGDEMVVYLHGYKIVSLNGRWQLTLDSCGFKTATTKARMNAVLGFIDAKVFQKAHAWYIRDFVTGNVYEFFDRSVTLQLTGADALVAECGRARFYTGVPKWVQGVVEEKAE